MKLHSMQAVAETLQAVQIDAMPELDDDPQGNYETLEQLSGSVATFVEAAEALAEEVEGRLADAERKADAREARG